MKTEYRNIALLFAGFFLLLLAAAVYAPVWYDDAGHYLVVQELIGEGVACYPVDLHRGQCDPNSPFITMGPALNYPLGSWMRIAGTSMFSGRMLMVLLSLQALLAFWLLSKQLVKPRKAFWAVALVIGNIQLVTYGAEILGEVPMLGWLFLGLAFQLRWWRGGGAASLLLATCAYVLAILTKEYIAGPLALAMGAWIVGSLLTRRRGKALGVLVQGLLITAAIGAYHLWQAGSWAGMLAWLQDRGSYGTEFLSFELGESLRFLLFKPLIVLGTVALMVKARLRRTPADLLIGAFHLAHLVFFLCSAGYDRFGFQLLFLPAIYLSEFMAVIWTRYCQKGSLPALRKIGFLFLFALLFSQKTLPSLAAKAFSGQPANPHERAAVSMLERHRADRLFTYDQQLIPFLPAGFQFRLSPTVPSNAANCESLTLKPGEWLLAGIYARTEFQNCIPWNDLSRVDATGTSAGHYVLYQRKK